MAKKEEPLLTAIELAEKKNVPLSYLRHARLKLGLKYYKLDKIRFKESDFDRFAAERMNSRGA